MELDELFPISTGRTKTGGLSISGQALSTLARKYGTPLYLYDAATVRHEVSQLQELGRKYYPGEFEITYASKAYLSLAFARHLLQMGMGIDVVSRGEMAIARLAGFPASAIHVHGNNKSEEELRLALEWDVRCIVVDSLEELAFLGGLARKMKKVARIWLRITPEVDVDTHPYRQTAHAASKFGIPLSDGQAAVGIRQAMKNKYLDLTGLHLHLGSQIFETEPFERAIRILYQLAEREGIPLREISPGGGWGVPYRTEDEDRPLDGWVEAICRTVQSEAGSRKWQLPRIVLEPGRRIVARAGVAIYTIGTTKETASDDVIIAVDGGMADNIRPALYKSKYTACLVERPDAEPLQKTIVVGKFCESGDRLITGIGLPDVKRGDLLAIPVAGAYQLSMASNYNLADRPAVLWLDGNTVEVMQRREKPEESAWWLNL